MKLSRRIATIATTGMLAASLLTPAAQAEDFAGSAERWNNFSSQWGNSFAANPLQASSDAARSALMIGGMIVVVPVMFAYALACRAAGSSNCPTVP